MPGFLAGVFVDREEQTGAVSLANTTAGLDPLVFGLLGRPARARAAGRRARGRPRPARCRSTASARGSGARRPTCCARSAAGCCTSGRSPGASAGPAGSRRRDGAWVGLDGYFAGETLRIAEDHLDLDTFVFTRTPYDPEAPVPGGVDEGGWR